MNTRKPFAFLTASVAALLLAGCASAPKGDMTREQILQQEDVKKKQPTVFNKGVEDVRLAGLRSLTFVGCKVKLQQPLYLMGERPRKMGLFVGSGGETVKIFLYPDSPTQTRVWVDTDLSFIGIAGQQGWDDRVIAEMKSVLETPVTTQ